MKLIIPARANQGAEPIIQESLPTHWDRKGSFRWSDSSQRSLTLSYRSCEEPGSPLMTNYRQDEEAFERQFELLRESLLIDLAHWSAEGGESERLGREKAAMQIRSCVESRRPRLYLGDLKLTSLPTIVFHLRFLEQLHLGTNNLRVLPETIGHLDRLTHLTLGGNLLTHLPDQIGRLTRLEVLDLSGNWLKYLPPAIGKLKSLEYLYIHTNPINVTPGVIRELPAQCTVTMWQPHDGILLVRVKERFRFPDRPHGPVILK